MSTTFGIHEKTVRAFTARPIRVGEIDIHPACMAHIMAIRLVCPGFEDDRLLPEEMLSAIVVFSTPPAEASALLNLSEGEWEERRRAIAGSVMLGDIAAFAHAIKTQVTDALAPAIPAKGGDSKKKAASAGGSQSLNAPVRNTARKKK